MQKVSSSKKTKKEISLEHFRESKEVITSWEYFFAGILMNLQILRAGHLWMMIYREE